MANLNELVPDIKISVNQIFGIDTEMKVDGFSKRNEYVPEIDNKYKFDSVGKNKKSNLMLHSYKINFSINNIKYKYVAELTDIFKKTLNEKYLKNYQQ